MKIEDIEEAHLRAIRVEVAKDVLKQLEIRAYIATPGVYVRFGEYKGKEFSAWSGSESCATLPDLGLDLQSLLPDLGPDCRVCGIGAAFVSYVRVFDKVKLGDKLGDSNAEEEHLRFLRGGELAGAEILARELLGMGFTGEIEQCFEGWEEYAEMAEGWGWKGSETRLRTIMENVVENVGVLAVPAEEHWSDEDDDYEEEEEYDENCGDPDCESCRS